MGLPMTTETAVYTIRFENSERTANEFEHINVSTDAETSVTTSVKDAETLEVRITGSHYTIPLVEEELKTELPLSAYGTCKVV